MVAAPDQSQKFEKSLLLDPKADEVSSFAKVSNKDNSWLLLLQWTFHCEPGLVLDPNVFTSFLIISIDVVIQFKGID